MSSLPFGRRTSVGLSRARVDKHCFEPRSAELTHARSLVWDLVVIEEPLQILIAGEPWITTMRTPGHDHELCAGYLLAEGLIESRADLGSIRHCGRGDAYRSVIDVLPMPGGAFALEDAGGQRTANLATSACGVCGRQQIEDLMARCGVISSSLCLSADTIRSATRQLRLGQPNFSHTGGCHAAGLLEKTGEFWVIREDIGRHNAVDKVLGRLLLDEGLPGDAQTLVVSGRISFEIVQKAAAARVPIVIGVSAPSSLAISTAERLGLTLIGFSRNDSFNVYAGAQRIA